jgi:hypothetical protein
MQKALRKFKPRASGDTRDVAQKVLSASECFYLGESPVQISDAGWLLC